MTKNRFFKLVLLCCACLLVSRGTKAFPDYLKVYNADPLAKAEMKGKCAVCHVNPAGGGPRNDFGKAFAAADHKITEGLRKQFPDYFASGQDAPSVAFTGDHEATVEINGKRYVINTQSKTVKAAEGAMVAKVEPKPSPTPDDEKKPDVYRPIDVRVISLPSAMALPKGSLWTDFTHRFPFGDPTDKAGLFGLDALAYPSFGVVYGVTDRIHVGAYRSPGGLGRAIQLQAGAQLLQETKGDPLSFQARIGLEGRDNFQRNFATSFDFTFARSITKYAQVYVTPTITVGDRPFTVNSRNNAKGTTAYALGGGLAVQILPSVSIMTEINHRLNKEARYQDGPIGINHPVFSFAIQKASASRRHGFSLVFSNSPGTTMSQRSQTRGLLFADDRIQGVTIGFNIVRRIF
ncbi:MAG: hypothetical protein HOP19_11910 [Acidobacteria bacterium]|nr:hypothetical protein [Acidobacteriota bacterium]